MITSLNDFAGNDSLVRLLRKAQMPSASLFSGPEGVGKKTLAVLLAGLANCHSPAEYDLCRSCPSCVKAVANIHPDIMLVDEAWLKGLAKRKKRKYNPQVIPIDAITEVVREAQFRPYQGRRRFFVIDEAEKMNLSAANALLKTLEEPPPTTRIVLVTAYPAQLLETVRSRCQEFKFHPLSRNQIEGMLGDQIPSEQIQLQAAFARGSIGRARTLNLSAVLEDRNLLLELMEDWVEKESFRSLFETVEKKPLSSDLRNRERVLELMEMLELLGQDLYLMTTGDSERIVNQDQLKRIRNLASRVDLEWIRSFLYHIREARRDIRSYVNSLICFETLWLKIKGHHA